MNRANTVRTTDGAELFYRAIHRLFSNEEIQNERK
jgi:hypothetical protein